MLHRTRMLGFAAGLAVMAAAASASAQNTSPTKVRVKAKSARIMNAMALTSDVVEEVTEGTELDVLLADDGWYWVVLPRDGYGTRRGGWVRIHEVEGADPDAITPKEARAQARRAKREARRHAEEEKRAAKAQARAAKKDERTIREAQRTAAKDTKRAEKGQATEDNRTASADNGSQPKEPKKKMTRAEAEQARRLKKAQDELEKARLDYDAALKKKSDPNAAVTPSAAPQR